MEALFLNEKHIAVQYPKLSESEIKEMLDEVVNDPIVKRTSLDKLSKHLLKNDAEASDNPRHVSSPIEIVEKSQQMYSENPERYIHGKKAIGIMKNKLQKARQDVSLLVSMSSELYQEDLHQLLK